MMDILPWLKGRWKQVALIAGLTAVAALAGFYHLSGSGDPAGKAVDGLFAAIGDGRLDDALGFVDPESELARFWNDNRGGIQDRVRKALGQYSLGFKLELETLREGPVAEVRLVGGTVKVGSREPGAQGAFPVSLDSLGLVFYLEEKDGRWLVTGINYEDLNQLVEGLRY